MTDVRFDEARNILLLGESRVVFHCHHYNVFLQRSVEDALGADAVEVQVSAAAESARRMLESLFREDGGKPTQERLARASALFGSLGFGLAELAELGPLGGSVRLPHSHYALGWREKFGAPQGPVCHFAAGYWAGALAAAAGLAPERVRAKETRCAALTGDAAGGCELSLEVR